MHAGYYMGCTSHAEACPISASGCGREREEHSRNDEEPLGDIYRPPKADIRRD
jgi:hypothetical protein